MCRKHMFLLTRVVQKAVSRGRHVPGGAVELGGPTTSRAQMSIISSLFLLVYLIEQTTDGQFWKVKVEEYSIHVRNARSIDTFIQPENWANFHFHKKTRFEASFFAIWFELVFQGSFSISAYLLVLTALQLFIHFLRKLTNSLPPPITSSRTHYLESTIRICQTSGGIRIHNLLIKRFDW